jgi:hypothetical protein
MLGNPGFRLFDWFGYYEKIVNAMAALWRGCG